MPLTESKRIQEQVYRNPLRLRIIGWFSCHVLFNSAIFANEIPFEIIEPRHLAQLGVKGLTDANKH